jgi:hypothetical protein
MRNPWWIAPALGLALGGCQLIGAIAANAERHGTRKVAARTDALSGRSFAVVIQADRSIQGEFPGLVEYISEKATGLLGQPTNVPRAAGFVPPADVIRYLYDNPGWELRPRRDLARALGGVQRLIVIDLNEYRLHDPGNPYLWDGAASATVTVFNPDSETSELPVMEHAVSVRFPDSSGMGPDQMDRRVVNSVLAARLAEKVAGLFYDHEEPNDAR